MINISNEEILEKINDFTMTELSVELTNCSQHIEQLKQYDSKKESFNKNVTVVSNILQAFDNTLEIDGLGFDSIELFVSRETFKIILSENIDYFKTRITILIQQLNILEGSGVNESSK